MRIISGLRRCPAFLPSSCLRLYFCSPFHQKCQHTVRCTPLPPPLPVPYVRKTTVGESSRQGHGGSMSACRPVYFQHSAVTPHSIGYQLGQHRATKYLRLHACIESISCERGICPWSTATTNSSSSNACFRFFFVFQLHPPLFRPSQEGAEAILKHKKALAKTEDELLSSLESEKVSNGSRHFRVADTATSMQPLMRAQSSCVCVFVGGDGAGVERVCYFTLSV